MDFLDDFYNIFKGLISIGQNHKNIEELKNEIQGLKIKNSAMERSLSIIENSLEITIKKGDKK